MVQHLVVGEAHSLSLWTHNLLWRPQNEQSYWSLFCHDMILHHDHAMANGSVRPFGEFLGCQGR